MAHFAQLDENNIVLRVIVVANQALDPINEEESGIKFLTEWSKGHTKWKQTSYNKKIRKNTASPGDFYDEKRDAFIPQRPFDSWLLDEESCQWLPPIPYPSDGGFYDWDEELGNWVEQSL